MLLHLDDSTRLSAALDPTVWILGTVLPPSPILGMCVGLENDLDSMQIIAELATPPACEVPTPLVVVLHSPMILPTAVLSQLSGLLTTAGPSRWANEISGLPCRVLHMELYTEGALFRVPEKLPVYELIASIRL